MFIIQKEIFMKNQSRLKNSFWRNALLSTVLVLSGVSAFALSPPASPVWTVQDGKLLDPNGNPFVFRGVTIDHTLAPEKTIQALKDAAALGANSAQIEFPIKPEGSYPRKIAGEIKEIVDACTDNKLVCVLEVNDSAGYYEVAGSENPSTVASLWSWDDVRETLNQATGNIIIGLNNNPLGFVIKPDEYSARMRNAIYDLRAYYPFHVIMIDGSRWSQDTDSALHTLVADNAAGGNSFKNIIYSVDMFDAYVNPETVRAYIESFSALNVPLVIGGFAPNPYYHPHFNGSIPLNAPRLPVESIMHYAQEYGFGYFGWSWSGNKNPALDLVNNWDKDNLTVWGNILFDDPNGIKATAELASIYESSSSSINSSASSSSVSANRPPVAYIDFKIDYVRCGQVYGEVSASKSYDPDGDPLTYQWEISGSVKSTEPSYRFYMQPPHYYHITLTVSDGRGGSDTLTISRNHTYSDYCTGSSSTTTSRSSVPSIVSSSSVIRSSSSIVTSSSIIASSSSVITTVGSSSSISARATCSYVVNSQWQNGFTAVIRIKNTTNQPINGWSVNWQYTDGSVITNSWNAALSGTNFYSAQNLNWNSNIQPGQTVEFGFQGTKPAGEASVPVITGDVCR